MPSETAEKSVFKLLMTGLEEAEGPKELSDVEKRIGRGKIDLLDALIRDAQDSFSLNVSESGLRQQMSRLEKSLASVSSAASGLVARRSVLLDRSRDLESQRGDNRRNAGEVTELLARFGLLRQQYESDLARLRMVAEAGTLMGYFHSGTCVFCGASPEHQQPGHYLEETTQLHEAVLAETRKTAELHLDLLSTIEDLELRLNDLSADHEAIKDAAAALNREFSELDKRLTPLNTSTQELLEARSQVEADLAIYAQIQHFEDLRDSFSGTSAATPPARPDGIPAADIARFERMIQGTLRSWKVPDECRVSYDQVTAEISLDGRQRRSRGKGMRSIIHAAFSTALASYTAITEHIHPGFVVLDSPVLTYRQPNDNDTVLTFDVVEHFYRGLIDNYPLQVVVIENGDPPGDLDRHAQVYAFSTPGSKRLGFFPPRS